MTSNQIKKIKVESSDTRYTNIRNTRYVVRHIPDKADYSTRWKLHNLYPVERYTTESKDWIECKAQALSAIMDVEKELSEVSVCEPGWLDNMPIMRYLFLILYPDSNVILFGNEQMSFMDIPISMMTIPGLKGSFFQTLTINREMSYHSFDRIPESHEVYYVCTPSFEGLTFQKGRGRELMRVKIDRVYVISEGTSGEPVEAIPLQVEEQVRAYYYSTTKKIKFTDVEVYDNAMASYYAQTNKVHSKLLSAVLSHIPEDTRCVFPMDGVGMGIRLRPGSVSGDRSVHWLTHEDVVQEEALDTLRRAEEGDVIVIVYGASFLSDEAKTYLSSISNPIIMIDAHYYPLPIRHVQVRGQTVWTYRFQGDIPALPSDTITIEKTPTFSDNLLYLDAIVDVREWTKTIAWYVISQRARVTSTIPWMKDFLIQIRANVEEGPSVPAYASYEKGKETKDPFFFIPIGTMAEKPVVLPLRVRYDLEVGKLYKVPPWLAVLFKQSCEDVVWSSYESSYVIEYKTAKKHSKIEVTFRKASFGTVLRKDNVTLEIKWKEKRGLFKREDPKAFPAIVRAMYGTNIPSAFYDEIGRWYGGIPPELFRAKS